MHMTRPSTSKGSYESLTAPLEKITYNRKSSSKYLVEVTGFLFVNAVISDVHLYLLADIPLIVEDEYLRRVWDVVCDELE